MNFMPVTVRPISAVLTKVHVKTVLSLVVTVVIGYK